MMITEYTPKNKITTELIRSQIDLNVTDVDILDTDNQGNARLLLTVRERKVNRFFEAIFWQPGGIDGFPFADIEICDEIPASAEYFNFDKYGSASK